MKQKTTGLYNISMHMDKQLIGCRALRGVVECVMRGSPLVLMMVGEKKVVVSNQIGEDQKQKLKKMKIDHLISYIEVECNDSLCANSLNAGGYAGDLREII